MIKQVLLIYRFFGIEQEKVSSVFLNRTQDGKAGLGLPILPLIVGLVTEINIMEGDLRE